MNNFLINFIEQFLFIIVMVLIFSLLVVMSLIQLFSFLLFFSFFQMLILLVILPILFLKCATLLAIKEIVIILSVKEIIIIFFILAALFQNFHHIYQSPILFFLLPFHLALYFIFKLLSLMVFFLNSTCNQALFSQSQMTIHQHLHLTNFVQLLLTELQLFLL